MRHGGCLTDGPLSENIEKVKPHWNSRRNENPQAPAVTFIHSDQQGGEGMMALKFLTL